MTSPNICRSRALPFVETYFGWSDRTCMESTWESLNLNFDIGTDYDLLLETLNSVGVRRIHFHHLLGIPAELAEDHARSKCAYDFTIHDYYAVCRKSIFLTL